MAKHGSTFAYRPALDGLRAIAVGSVVVYHVDDGWLPGGFLGVDIFFVLSGFLIATLLLREYDENGRIDLPGFWTRRFRRLMPALIVAILVIAIVENILLDDALLRSSRRDELMAALFYVANWFFVVTDSSYFTLYTDASPVRHTWSLAIEEQFYIGFPLLMAFGLAANRRRWLRAFFAIGTVASIATMAVLYDPASASRAYYGTDSRIFQMLIGVLLAWAMHVRADRAVFTMLGRATPALLATLGAMFVFISDQSAVYYYGGAVAVAVVTAGLIVALETESPTKQLLASKPMTAIGLISYGVYLWHWPIILWLRNNAGLESTLVVLAATIAATAAAAFISYQLVERPIRKNGALFGLELSPRRLAMLVPVVSLFTAGTVYFNLPDATPEWASNAATGPLQLADALAETDETDGRLDAEDPDEDQTETDATPTTEAPPEPIDVVAVVGDSFVVSAYPGLRTAAADRGWQLLEAAFPACPVGSEPLANADGTESPYAERCATQVIPSYQELIKADPDLIIWHDLQSTIPRFADDGTVLLTGEPAWQEDLVKEWIVQLDFFLSEGLPLVITIPPLRSIDPVGCEGALDPRRCADIQLQDDSIRAATADFRDQVEGRDGLWFIEVDSILCPDANPCPEIIDGIQIREGARDQTHFTAEGAAWFAPLWFDAAVAAVEN